MNKEDIYKTIKNESDKKLLDSRIVDLLFDQYDTVSSYVKERQAIAKDFYANRFLKVSEQIR